jgi:aminoglycoside phosphotransferase (APT) family kinase protein
MASSNTGRDNRHDLDDVSLGNYLVHHLPNLNLPVKSTKIGYGQSNPTYFVDDAAGTRFILRKRPSGTIISPVAHQIDREYRVINCLGKVPGFPVPKAYCFCTDASIIGTTFYVRHNPDDMGATCPTPMKNYILITCTGHGICQRSNHYRSQSRRA